jgi:hypothetical protein
MMMTICRMGERFWVVGWAVEEEEPGMAPPLPQPAGAMRRAAAIHKTAMELRRC